MSREELEKLIYIKHPHKQTGENQIDFLLSRVDDNFDFWLLSMNFGNASYRYMSLARGEETIEDFEDWLEGLPERVRNTFRKEGFEAAKSTWPFRRYVMERRDLGMDEYIKRLLRSADWEKWNEYKKSDDNDQ